MTRGVRRWWAERWALKAVAEAEAMHGGPITPRGRRVASHLVRALRRDRRVVGPLAPAVQRLEAFLRDVS